MEAAQARAGPGRAGQGRLVAWALAAAVAVCVKAAALSQQPTPPELLSGDPYGTLARSAPEADGGRGVLARAVGGRAANAEGALGEVRSSALAMGGDLSGAGMGADNSWQETGPESAYPGGFLFDRSLARSSRDVAFERDQGGSGVARRARGGLRAPREAVDGSLASLPSTDAASEGVLSVTSGDDGRGTLAHMADTNPDGVLAIYGHTGEYVERKRLVKQEKHLKALEDMEAQAQAMHRAQVKRLRSLEAREERAVVAHKAARAAASSAAGAADFKASRAQTTGARMAAAAAAGKEGPAAAAAAPAIGGAAAKRAHSKAVAAAAAAPRPAAAHAAHAAHRATRSVGGGKGKVPLSKLGEAPADKAGEEGAEEGEEGGKGGVGSYEDIGWTKKEWGASSWVLFFIFGPIATAAIVGLVWHCAGMVPALVMLFILLCLDLVSYYYSWYLV